METLWSQFQDYANSFNYPADRGYVETQMATGMMMTFLSIEPLQVDRERRLKWLNNQLQPLGFKSHVCEKLCDWLVENLAKEKDREKQAPENGSIMKP